jgi:hypothetical protein
LQRERAKSRFAGREDPCLLESLRRQLLEVDAVVDVAQEQMQRGLVGVGRETGEEFPTRLLLEPFPEEEASSQEQDGVWGIAREPVGPQEGQCLLDTGGLGGRKELKLGSLHRLGRPGQLLEE